MLNDREAARRARREFNVALKPSTVGKWRKLLLETGRMQKIKPPRMPRISTDAETTKRIVEAFDASPQKSTPQAARELHISQSSVCRVLKRGWNFVNLCKGISKRRTLDGAPPHYAIAVREILDDHLQNRWVGRRGSIEWPARSPDLTACDYWLWGYLKEKVYARKHQDVDMLKLVIEEENRAIPLNMYHNAMNDFLKRCQLCLDANGEQFEAIK
ncbi:hypothetical protein L9F63_024657 [Diploptera punctata]|uniref:Transposase n=1 Tax=Diploptera punctata TaxID=6984 RepID=A0AAD7ZF63_DIPPU|nr:hypothetical protein L9F63_024657 [Diploptera punctata]